MNICPVIVFNFNCLLEGKDIQSNVVWAEFYFGDCKEEADKKIYFSFSF